MFPQNLTLIPLTEKLPEENQNVIVWNGKKLLAAKYVTGNVLVSENPYLCEPQGMFEVEKYPCNMDRSIITYWQGITHWMPAEY